MSATSARRQKKIIRKRERTSAGIPVGQLCGRSGHLSDILFQYSASAGILCGRPQNVHWTSARMSVRRPPECPSDVRRISVGRPPECPSHPPECPSDVRQNVRWMSVRMCRKSARMSAGCPLECVGHQPECPMDVCRTSAMSAQKNVCKNSFRVTSPLV